MLLVVRVWARTYLEGVVEICPGIDTYMEEGAALLTAEPLWLGSEAETKAQDTGALTSALSQKN